MTWSKLFGKWNLLEFLIIYVNLYDIENYFGYNADNFLFKKSKLAIFQNLERNFCIEKTQYNSMNIIVDNILSVLKIDY